jgi:colanic acid biosynthesis protein WcaH
MRLGHEQFLEVVERAPLVSIDLIVRRENGEVLLGKRMNEPARDYWFVPGGRIHKNETIADAFRRISANELGRGFGLEEAKFVGVFEHFYPTNFGQKAGFGTHYVVLAYELADKELPAKLPADQHGEFRWFTVDAIRSTESVHKHTQGYFLGKA